MCILIKTNGETRTVHPKNGKEWSLEELQGFVGGMIELFPTGKEGTIMVLHEEGKLQSNPKLNIEATHIASPNLMLGDWIAGDVLIATERSMGE